MNLEGQKLNGVDVISLSDSLSAPLLEIRVKKVETTVTPNTNDLIIFVDKAEKSTPTDERRQYIFNLAAPLLFYNQVSDEFYVQLKVKDNDVIMESFVKRLVESTEDGYVLLENNQIEVLDSFPITLFEGTNYIYTNYSNADIELIYSKNDEFNKRYLNNALFYAHKLRNLGEFSLDDIYFKDAFTKTEEKLNIEVNNANIDCLTSRNNKFSLDIDGNLIVNSITTAQNPTSNTGICDLVYPIGSIYMSVSNTNPTSLFGGSWEQLKDKFLLCAGDIYGAGTTGGEASHVLSINEVPSHNHSFSQTSCTNPGNHTHVVGVDKDGGAGTNRYTVHITSNNTANGQQLSPISGAAGSHTHTIGGSISNTGGSQSHNNMPPYLAVYIWKRIA